MMMETMIIILSCFVVLAYLLLILIQIYFFNISKSNYTKNQRSVSISIVVPIRNEEKRISDLIQSFNNFKNVESNWEVIFVDDHSEDLTQQVIRRSANFPHSIILSKDQGKKKAVETGVLNAQYEVIASVDADVKLDPDWLTEVGAFFDNPVKNLLIMPVLLDKEVGIAGYFESLDVLALTGSTIAWASIGNPIMCNGANMAYRKSAFEKFRLNPTDGKVASGDDVFFLHQVKCQNKNAIGYICNESVIAKTGAFNNIGDVVNQRVRWASKALVYQDKTTLLISWIVMLTYLLILGLGIGSIVYPTLIKLFLITFGLKIIVDFLFLVLLASRFNKYPLLVYYPMAVVVQIFTMPLILVRSIWGTFEWKERHYNR